MKHAEHKTDQSLHLPADRFYWAVLDGALLPRRRHAARQALGYLFESHLPVALESIHAVYVKANDGDSENERYVACGMDRAQLTDCVESNGQLLHLGPSELPGAGCMDADIHPESINLLSGAFEPVPIAQRRRRWIGSLVALAVLIAGGIFGGAWRRAAMLDAHRAEIQQATTEIYKKVLGPRALRTSSGQSPALRLIAERRELQRTRRDNVEQYIDRDAAVALEQLLTRWPRDLHVATRSVIVSGSTITVRAAVPSSDDAQRLADALGDVPGFSLDQPRMSATSGGRASGGGAVQVTLHWQRRKDVDT